MWDCGSIKLVGVGALILVCELGRLLPGKVSHSEVRDGERDRGRVSPLEARGRVSGGLVKSVTL